eukprot:TRINITY_DN4268_c0_g1_i1.p1 TRINITY_DN4268_c0_g1~~TRINITY_DN4268_c0_g1_i1.p1  ORF type:complete len:202 (+),score=18.86 TRINITY_DN4268_c0_g1_i1:120-725(+)
MSHTTPFASLPPEIRLLISQLVHFEDLFSLCVVSKACNDLFSRNEVWEKVLAKLWSPLNQCEVLSDLSAEEAVNLKAVMVNRVLKFGCKRWKSVVHKHALQSTHQWCAEIYSLVVGRPVPVDNGGSVNHNAVVVLKTNTKLTASLATHFCENPVYWIIKKQDQKENKLSMLKTMMCDYEGAAFSFPKQHSRKRAFEDFKMK